MIIQLDINSFNILDEIFTRFALGEEVAIYGSRVQGVAKKYSDLDVLVDLGISKTGKELNQSTFYELDEELINSDLAFRVDLKSKKNMSIDFLHRINKQLVPWQHIQYEFRS